MLEVICICFKYLEYWKLQICQYFSIFRLICGIFFSHLAVLAVDDFSISFRSTIHCVRQGEGIILPLHR